MCEYVKSNNIIFLIRCKSSFVNLLPIYKYRGFMHETVIKQEKVLDNICRKQKCEPITVAHSVASSITFGSEAPNSEHICTQHQTDINPSSVITVLVLILQITDEKPWTKQCLKLNGLSYLSIFVQQSEAKKRLLVNLKRLKLKPYNV